LLVEDVDGAGRPDAVGELGAMLFPDPHALDEAERRAQPVHRGAHVGIDELGDHGGGRVERPGFTRARA
jgi:hypothetical protein